jgi:hypothetical protein
VGVKVRADRREWGEPLEIGGGPIASAVTRMSGWRAWFAIAITLPVLDIKVPTVEETERLDRVGIATISTRYRIGPVASLAATALAFVSVSRSLAVHARLALLFAKSER